MGETLSTSSAFAPQLSQMASQRLLLLFRKDAMMLSSRVAACTLASRLDTYKHSVLEAIVWEATRPCKSHL